MGGDCVKNVNYDANSCEVVRMSEMCESCEDELEFC